MQDNIWLEKGSLTEEDKRMLEMPFTMTEIEKAVKEMKSNTAPGPDGFHIGFYKHFWEETKYLIKEIMDNLFEGTLNLSRLNYGLITLIPKMKEANNIKQYRPICLLNVSYKIVTKILANRLTKVTDEVIDATQTAFIPGRYILEGVVIIHETIHELQKTRRPRIILKLDFAKAYDKVQWHFLEEVLVKKNFPHRWIGWIKQVVEGGRVGINLNGTPGEYFRTYKGLRQGDPLSPLLFNIVTDALGTMLKNARDRGHIKGVIPHLVEGGLTHLQYADDTVIMMDRDDDSITNTKLLLYCFEMMPGLQINYDKSEVFVIGTTQADQIEVAKIFNCKVGTFPMTYIGIPISSEPVRLTDLMFVRVKIRKRLSTWQCRYLSYGGKTVLMDSSLSSIPIYTMGFYLLPEILHENIDTDTANFFWHGIEGKRKYHMVKWEAMSTPREWGGLGCLETRTMNKCLLGKWIYKIEKGDTYPCTTLLRKKYLGDRGFYNSNPNGGSQFWKGLHEIKDEFSQGLKYILGDGKKIRFWIDVWIGECPLKITYDNIFKICEQQNATIREIFDGSNWNLTFRRNYGPREMMEWDELLQDLKDVRLKDEPDNIRWMLESSGKYTVRSLYKHLLNPGARYSAMTGFWEAKIPLKVKVFLWLLNKDIIQATEQLKKKNWKGSDRCKMCGLTETPSHVIFQCAPVKWLWWELKECIGWDDAPNNISDINIELWWKDKNDKNMIAAVIAAACWIIWQMTMFSEM